jgi:hypothetical protein
MASWFRPIDDIGCGGQRKPSCNFGAQSSCLKRPVDLGSAQAQFLFGGIRRRKSV